MLQGRSTFTRSELDQIRRLVREKQVADRDRQKSIRARLRAMGFRISDFANHAGFVESDLDDLIARGAITVIDEESGETPTVPSPARSETVSELRTSAQTMMTGGDALDRFVRDALRSLAGQAPLHQVERGVPARPGLYAIYGDAETWKELGLGDPPDERPLYVGKAEDSLVARDLDMHIYHFAEYEPTALKRLMGAWGTREDAVDELLRRELFVDLYRVVAESLPISYERYGLKKVERFFMPKREEDVAAGDDSIVVFEQWLESGDDKLLHAIERYNEFDCLATLALRDWLLERRTDAGVARWKEPPAPREFDEEKAEAIAERERLRQELLAGAEEGDERWTVAQLLEYHRREDRPVWWHYFRRLEGTEEHPSSAVDGHRVALKAAREQDFLP